MSLSKRLTSCLKFTQGFNKLADIGTDHAQLTIAAVESGFVSEALAIDNKIGPFSIAYNNVKNSDFYSKIRVLLSDGLKSLDDKVDVVVIAGMGGILIKNILINDSLRNVKRFILQPNNDPDSIREILHKIGYYIVDELIINDKGKYYDLIIIEPGTVDYTKLQIVFGPINLKEKPRFFVKRIEEELERLKELLLSISLVDRRITIEARIVLLEEALK